MKQKEITIEIHNPYKHTDKEQVVKCGRELRREKRKLNRKSAKK